MELRYVGFDQAKNVREYKFDAVEDGAPARRVVVSVDLALFLKHHIGMQEGPALCLKKLAAAAGPLAQSGRHQLCNDDLLAYAVSRAAALERKAAARKYHKPHRRGPEPSRWSRPPGAQ